MISYFCGLSLPLQDNHHSIGNIHPITHNIDIELNITQYNTDLIQ